MRIAASGNGTKCTAASPPDARPTGRSGSAVTPRTDASMHRRSSLASRSRARASRSDIGSSRATRSMSPRSSGSRRICRAGSSAAVCSSAMPGWCRRPTSRSSPGAAASTSCACRSTAAVRSRRQWSPDPVGTRSSPTTSRSRKSPVGDGERRRRYVVCYNPEEAERQKQHRDQVLKELEAEIDGLRTQRGASHSKRVCELRASGRYGRYLRLTRGDVPRINQAALAAAERLDGKFVVHSNDDTLSAADLALGYKQLQRVEIAWRSLKSGLKLRPVFHWAPHRIHAHVALTVLSLLLERVAEQACGDTWRNIRDDLRRIKLAQLLSPNGTVWQVTEPTSDALKRLKSLQIQKPPPILHLD